ncbi:MAG: class I SAM-dependent methyltransferase [Candidatus Binataceae bacterium]
MAPAGKYDLTLYESTAYYYARFRPPYPPSMVSVLREKFSLDGRGRMLDLGCGTGYVAIPMAHLFEQVVAMDPDPGMIDEGRAAAARAGVRNIDWKLGGSEDLSDGLGRFRLVTIGNAFHWMNRERTLDRLYDLVEEDGGLAIVGQGAPFPAPPPVKWRAVINEVIARYLGPERRAGQGTYSHPKDRHEPAIRRSRFRGFTEYRELFDPTWTIDSIIGNLYSMSFCSRRLLGDRVGDFERDLRAALLAAEPSGVLREEPGEFFLLMASKQQR